MEARVEAGYLLRSLQQGHVLRLPHARPMAQIAPGCYELRINDAGATWRIIYRIDPDAIIILEVLSKKTSRTPHEVVETCRRRLRSYDNA